jgi:hypothetical protein
MRKHTQLSYLYILNGVGRIVRWFHVSQYYGLKFRPEFLGRAGSIQGRKDWTTNIILTQKFGKK